MLKTLFALSFAAALAVPTVHAQGNNRQIRSMGAGAARPVASARPSSAGRPSFAMRSPSLSSHSIRGSRSNDGGRFGNGRGGYNGYRSGNNGNYRGGRYGHHHHGGRGRYYYLGGIPYFYPFYSYGFGYPYYYGAYYGSTYPYEGSVYEGRIADGDDDEGVAAPSGRQGASLPAAVQRQLAKRGYYKGTIDGQFGPASRSALRRFQRDNDLNETGRIDEKTLEELGFSDER